MPVLPNPSRFLVAPVRSYSRPATYGPRSITGTVTSRPAVVAQRDPGPTRHRLVRHAQRGRRQGPAARGAAGARPQRVAAHVDHHAALGTGREHAALDPDGVTLDDVASGDAGVGARAHLDQLLARLAVDGGGLGLEPGCGLSARELGSPQPRRRRPDALGEASRVIGAVCVAAALAPVSGRSGLRIRAGQARVEHVFGV